MCRAFFLINDLVRGNVLSGHALVNVRNVVTLASAKDEIEMMLKQNKKDSLNECS